MPLDPSKGCQQPAWGMWRNHRGGESWSGSCRIFTSCQRTGGKRSACVKPERCGKHRNPTAQGDSRGHLSWWSLNPNVRELGFIQQAMGSPSRIEGEQAGVSGWWAGGQQDWTGRRLVSHPKKKWPREGRRDDMRLHASSPLSYTQSHMILPVDLHVPSTVTKGTHCKSLYLRNSHIVHSYLLRHSLSY